MKKYEYTKVEYTSILLESSVTLQSTDQRLLDRFQAEVERLVSTAKVTERKYPGSSSEVYYRYFHELKGQEEGIYWWIMRELCHLEWEPLGQGEFRKEL